MLAIAGDALGGLSEEKDTIGGGHIKLKTLEREREGGERVSTHNNNIMTEN